MTNFQTYHFISSGNVDLIGGQINGYVLYSTENILTTSQPLVSAANTYLIATGL